MPGDITIGDRQVAERPLWAVVGVVGLFVPITVWSFLLTMLFPPLSIALLAGVGWVGMRMRGRASASRSRVWSFAAWAVATGIWHWMTSALAFPPGSALPTGPLAVVIYAVLVVLQYGGSVAIALGSYEIGRRYLWRDARTT